MHKFLVLMSGFLLAGILCGAAFGFERSEGSEGSVASGQPLSPTDVTGLWYLDDNSQVEIAKCADSVCGTLEWFSELEGAQGPILDLNNPDKELQNRELKGVQMIYGFSITKKGRRKGKIYDPASGKTYKSKLTRIDDNRLKVEGCVGPFCQKFFWTKQAK